jgi:ParB/RepB/Spo0J family partition protein
MNTGGIDDNGEGRGETPTALGKADHSDPPVGKVAEEASQAGHQGPHHGGETAVPAAPVGGANARYTLLQKLEAHVMIDVAAIRHSEAKRVIRPGKVAKLADSIREIGLRTPITVRAVDVGHDEPRFEIVAGHHRYAAVRSLGMQEIACHVMQAGDPDAELWAVDENLCRTELTPAEEAEHLKRHKASYLARHPETREHVAGGRARQNSAADKLSAAPSFVTDTAAKVGKDERSIRRAVARAERIAPDVLKAVVGTQFDKGAALDALAKLPHEQQRQAVATGKLSLPQVMPEGQRLKSSRPEDDDDVIDLVQMLTARLTKPQLKEAADIARRIGNRFSVPAVFIAANNDDGAEQ